MSKQESYLVRNLFGNLKFITNNEIENLIPNSSRYDLDGVSYLKRSLSLQLSQQNNQQLKQLNFFSTLQIIYDTITIYRNFQAIKFPHLFVNCKKKSLLFLAIQNGGINFNENLDEVQMRKDFQSLKICSTESTTESRISTLIYITQPQINPIHKFDNEGNQINQSNKKHNMNNAQRFGWFQE